MNDGRILLINVKRICKEQHITLKEVCFKAGYSYKYLSTMAAKKTAVTINHIRLFSQALNVKPERLMIGMFDENNAEIFKHNIQILCEENGITLTEIMEKAGYNKNHLHHLSCKHISPSEENIRCYAKALNVEPERLMEGMADDY